MYHRNMVKIMTAKLGYAVANLLIEGTAVHWARNTAVRLARELEADELVFIDKDLDVPLEAFQLLMSYEHEKIICGTYAKRSVDTYFHGAPWQGPRENRADGLIRMHQCSIGCCKIRMSVFDTMAKAFPDRAGFQYLPSEGDPVPVTEFFPMELVGENTPAGRLKRIATILDGNDGPVAKLVAVRAALTERTPNDSLYVSEDYGFCRLAREAGIPIYLDPKLVVQHEATVKVPITTEHLLSMLKEPWRQPKDPTKEIVC